MPYDIKDQALVAECYRTNDFQPLYALGNIANSSHSSMGLGNFLMITALEGYPLDRYLDSLDNYFTRQDVGLWFGGQLGSTYSPPGVEEEGAVLANKIVDAVFNNKEAQFFLFCVLKPSSDFGTSNYTYDVYYRKLLEAEPLSRGSQWRSIYLTSSPP